MKNTKILNKNNNKKVLHPIVNTGRYVFLTNNKLLTSNLLEMAISNFWTKKIDGKFIKGLHHVTILLKIELVDGSARSIGRVQFLKDETQLKDYITYIQHLVEVKYNHYLNASLNAILFEYSIREGAAPRNTIITNIGKLNQSKSSFEINHNHFKLPAFLNPLDYGQLIRSVPEDSGATTYFMQSATGNLFIICSKLINNLYHNVVELYHKGILGVNYTDEQIDSNNFVRKTDTKIYHYTLNSDNEWYSDFNYSIKPTKYISTIEKHRNKSANIITLDIECIPKPMHDEEGNHAGDNLMPALISYYDGEVVKSFFIGDYECNSEKMFHACIDSLLVKKYENYSIYAHNFGKFDGVILFGHLYKYGVPNIIKNNNGTIISASVKTNRLDNPNQSITLKFFDSLLLLNSSLAKLTKAFNTDIQKDIFPFGFMKEENLNYVGEIPSIEYFNNGVSVEEYKKYVDRFNSSSNFNGVNWSFKNELIKYCELDCISLHQVLTKFSDLIWELFQINITKYPTISGLAFAIFRSNFMKCLRIPQICNDFFKKIRASYTGGSTDMLVPSNLDENRNSKCNLYCYDVNSLYPYTMATSQVPTGRIITFEGDASKYLPDKLGYYLVDVIAPVGLKHPIIQNAIHFNNVNAMASTLGKWRMLIYSEEMLNAIKYGYQFNVLAGVVFEEKESIFKEYVDFMYDLRMKYSKDHPLNYIAKLLLNSLYGRFGMDDNFPVHKIIDAKDWRNYFGSVPTKKLNDIYDITRFGKFFVVSTKKELDTENYGFHETHNVNVAIASAITANARIFMSQFKNKSEYKLWYSDTDSLFINYLLV